MKMLTIGTAMAIALSVGDVEAATIGSYDSFSQLRTGSTRPLNIIESADFNNFFRFNLAGITGPVTGATLSIISTGTYSTSLSEVTYSVYDITTDLTAVGTSARTASYLDAQSGTLFGSTTIATPGNTGRMPALSFALNSDAVGAINSSLGGLFDLGGNSSLTAGGQFLWSSSNDGEPVATLTLDVAAIPLPAGLPLLLAGLGGFAVLRRVQRKA